MKALTQIIKTAPYYTNMYVFAINAAKEAKHGKAAKLALPKAIAACTSTDQLIGGLNSACKITNGTGSYVSNHVKKTYENYSLETNLREYLLIPFGYTVGYKSKSIQLKKLMANADKTVTKQCEAYSLAVMIVASNTFKRSVARAAPDSVGSVVESESTETIKGGKDSETTAPAKTEATQEETELAEKLSSNIKGGKTPSVTHKPALDSSLKQDLQSALNVIENALSKQMNIELLDILESQLAVLSDTATNQLLAELQVEQEHG